MSATPDARHFPVGESSTGGYSPIVVLRSTPTPRPHSLHALIDVSHRLRPRDYVLACLLDEHTTLTTDQITTILFANPTTCRHRLHTLRRIGFIDRFLRNRPGAANPICWVPGVLSARFVALSRDDTPPTARALRERQDRIYASPKLEHLLAGNQFFVNLLSHARTHPGTGLLRWWSERSTAASYGQRIHPDGHGIWSEDDHTTGFFLELDRGTEPIGTLAAKLGSHRRLQAEGGPSYPVLFVVPNRTREQNLHRRLADRPEPGVVVATTSPEAGDNPAGPVWRVAGNGRHRLTLIDLPGSHGQLGPINPAEATADQHPLGPLG